LRHRDYGNPHTGPLQACRASGRLRQSPHATVKESWLRQDYSDPNPTCISDHPSHDQSQGQKEAGEQMRLDGFGLRRDKFCYLVVV